LKRPAAQAVISSFHPTARISVTTQNGCIVSGAKVYGSVLFTKVRVAAYSLIEDSVLLPDVVVGRNVILKRVVVDNGCFIPDGFQVGVNPDADRARLHVTDLGITLITPECSVSRLIRCCNPTCGPSQQWVPAQQRRVLPRRVCKNGSQA